MKSVLQSVSPRGIRASLIVFLFLGLIFSPLSSAQADGTAPPFAFSQTTPLVLASDAPNEVSLINQSRADLSVQVWLTDFGFEPLSAETEIHWPMVRLEWGKEYVSNQDVLKPLTVKLAGGQSQRILLNLNGADLEKVKPGTYTAFVMAGESGQSSQVAHLEVQVVVEKKPAAGLPKPLLEAVTLQALRPLPWHPAVCPAPCLLPLDAADADSAQAAVGQALGFLVGPNGEYVQVKAAQVSVDTHQPIGLSLDFQNLGGAGAYTGKLDLTKAADKSGVVAVTVNVKDAIWAPLLVLVIGIVVAWWAQRYITVGRKVADLRKRKTDLEKGKLRNEITIDLKKLKADIEPYKIDDAQMTARFQKLEEQFRALEKIAAPRLEDSNEDYKAAIAELDVIESQIKLWQSFSGKYEKLKTAFDTFPKENPGPKPGWPAFQQPAFYADAEDLIKGRQVELAEAATVGDRLDKAALLLASWQKMSGTISAYRMRVQDLLAVSSAWQEAYRLDLYNADRILCQAWGDLWLAKDADDLITRSASADIQHAEALLLGLHDVHQASVSSGVKGWEEVVPYGISRDTDTKEWDSTKEEKRETEPAAPIPLLAGLFSIFGPRVERPADIDLNASYSNLLRWLREGAIAILALLIALSAAATSLYIDKNFGTWQDYIAAFTWGVTTKALVSGLDYAIGNFRGTLPDLKA
ncbi:MAG: hypothetical protein HY869_02480 [Chloroflexi bacterium]|nr:hypothetical protein [Chloroflexota bacterium]